MYTKGSDYNYELTVRTPVWICSYNIEELQAG